MDRAQLAKTLAEAIRINGNLYWEAGCSRDNDNIRLILEAFDRVSETAAETQHLEKSLELINLRLSHDKLISLLRCITNTPKGQDLVLRLSRLMEELEENTGEISSLKAKINELRLSQCQYETGYLMLANLLVGENEDPRFLTFSDAQNKLMEMLRQLEFFKQEVPQIRKDVAELRQTIEQLKKEKEQLQLTLLSYSYEPKRTDSE